MNGSAAHQIKNLYTKSGIDQIGHSKHLAKNEARNSISASRARSVTWHELGKGIGVYSYATQNAYRDVWRNTFKFAKENFQIKDIEKLTAEHVVAYLQSKIDAGIAHATFLQYASAIEKLETALNLYSEKFTRGKEYNFSSSINSVRQEAHVLQHFNSYRDYSKPREIIEALHSDTHRIVALLQLEVGLRIKETNIIRENQLLLNDQIKITGKGGKVRILNLPPDLYAKLENKIESGNGLFQFNQNSYRNDIKKAAETTNQEYHGTHGLRWNYAQEKFQEYQLNGETYEEAKEHVSGDLGHNRADITLHYLGK